MWSRERCLNFIQTSAQRWLPQRGPPWRFYPIPRRLLCSLSVLSYCFIFLHSSHPLPALHVLLLIYHWSSSLKCKFHGEGLRTSPCVCLVPTWCSWWALSTVYWMKETVPVILPPSEPLRSHHSWLRENIQEGQHVGMERKLNRRAEKPTRSSAERALSLWGNNSASLELVFLIIKWEALTRWLLKIPSHSKVSLIF